MYRNFAGMECILDLTDLAQRDAGPKAGMGREGEDAYGEKEYDWYLL